MIISILGCGWLGFPVGLHLLSEGHQVKGSTTTEKKLNLLQSNGLQPFIVNITDRINGSSAKSFWDTDVLFLNIPPGRSGNDVLERYPGQIEKVAQKASDSGISWIIFASSTSVYDMYGGLVAENDADTSTASSESGKALLMCEDILAQYGGFDFTIVRFGGLYGYDRHPVKFFAGKDNLEQANKPINFIHQDDCVQIISEIIKQNIRNEVFNAVSDGHPPRREFYQSAADHFGMERPKFQEDKRRDYKVVSNNKLKEVLDYSFKYPNPMDHTP